MPVPVRRLGTSPVDRPGPSSLSGQCPDVIELDDGSYAVIGRYASAAERIRIKDWLAEHDGGIHDSETAVIVPRAEMLAAALEITARDKRAAVIAVEDAP